MDMDPRFRGFSGSINGIQMINESISVFPNEPISHFTSPSFVSGPRFENSFLGHGFGDYDALPPPNPTSSGTLNEDSVEDCDFSNAVLVYINQMLMEEDMEEKTCMLQDSLDLQAAEKSFYDVLGQKYPPSPVHIPGDVNESLDGHLSENHCSSISNRGNDITALFDDSIRMDNPESLDGHLSENHCSSISNRGNDITALFDDSIRMDNPGECQYSWNFRVPSVSQSSVMSSVEELPDSPSCSVQVPDWTGEIQSICQFRKGVEEANKFLPRGNNVFGNLPNEGMRDMVVKEEKKDEGERSSSGVKGRKNFRDENFVAEEEERSSKQAAVYSEPLLRSDLFDMVLLCSSLQGQTEFSALRQALQNGKAKTFLQDGQSKASNGVKGRGKKQSGKKEVIDLRTLLIHCAQAVAADDRRNANELLKQIRQHASSYGDGNQRLAYYFADGLEARLAGTGSQIYKGLVSKRTSAASILKAYLLHTAASPFRKVSHFLVNKTIVMTASNSARLHVIDFGILYGFQWPTLIQRLSMRPGGPPKLRITGIEFPQPGFRPAERVEETGLRLAAYAEEFKVPFEYNAIAKRWDAIKLEELKIDRDEVTIVNCLYRAKNLFDESVAANSPKTIVLNLIRQINPDLFIHGIVNGSYNAPFYVTRFREALFHFTAMFDMLDTIVPRDDPQRMLIEKELLGREALNIIACEGWERVERPETYKQWQVRVLRAGFSQISFDRRTVKQAVDRVRNFYYKDFIIDQDNRWIVQGWKGRIIYAISAWKPA